MKFVLPFLLSALSATSLQAQDAPADWDMIRTPKDKLTIAYSQFNNGVTIAVRCVDRGYEALVTGLPAAAGKQRRPLGLQFEEDEEMSTRDWTVAIDETVAVSDLPARFARQLREGGQLKILVPNGAPDWRNLRYDLTLPRSSASIDETLTTCGLPVDDPRDTELEALPESGLPVDITWSRPPRPDYPANTRYARGFAVVSCVSDPDGSLRDCAVESEFPRDAGFGDSSLRAARRGRLENVGEPGAPVPARLVVFRNNFIVSGYETAEERAARSAPREERRRSDR